MVWPLDMSVPPLIVNVPLPSAPGTLNESVALFNVTLLAEFGLFKSSVPTVT